MFEIRQQEYVVQKVGKLTPHPENARRGNKGVIGESMDVHGFYGTIIVQKSTGYIVAGNHRYRVAVEKGAKELPTLVMELTDKEAMEILLIDNRANDEAGYDEAALTAILQKHRRENGTLVGTGYNDQDMLKMARTALEDAEAAIKASTAANEKEVAPERLATTNASALRYQIVVHCSGEEHQASVLDQLEALGLECKPIIQ